MQIKTIGVVGAGLMGHGIAQDFATAGYQVVLNDNDPVRLQAAPGLIRENLATMAGLGIESARPWEAILGRVALQPSLPELAAASDYVVEAVAEDLTVKHQVFAELNRHGPPHQIVASNTSSLLPDRLAEGTTAPHQLLVTHYFNPPHLVPLVEVVGCSMTSAPTLQAAAGLLRGVGKRLAILSRAVPGFIVNRLQAALVREAVSLVNQGVATHIDIDTAVRHSIAPRMAAGGLFEVYDLAGWDVIAALCANVLADLNAGSDVGEPVRGMVAAGDLGVKTGRGFYEWSPARLADLRGRVAVALARLHKPADQEDPSAR